jgi:hypothetical protein
MGERKREREREQLMIARNDFYICPIVNYPMENTVQQVHCSRKLRFEANYHEAISRGRILESLKRVIHANGRKERKKKGINKSGKRLIAR